jgi:putative Mg2+ transporter-C (MgtC) family protein
MSVVGLAFGDIALRLGLAILAGLTLGFDRGEHGKPAGMRTSTLVCMAAALAMIIASDLLGTRGKQPDSFVTMDVMRLHLGILSGMGFIGAGAILKRGETVAGLTTAASLWFITVVGICFGAGLFALGLTSLVLGLVVLTGIRWVETRTPSFHRGKLTLTVTNGGLAIEDIARAIDHGSVTVRSWKKSAAAPDHERYELTVLWRKTDGKRTPDFVVSLGKAKGVVEVDWQQA